MTQALCNKPHHPVRNGGEGVVNLTMMKNKKKVDYVDKMNKKGNIHYIVHRWRPWAMAGVPTRSRRLQDRLLSLKSNPKVVPGGFHGHILPSAPKFTAMCVR